MHLAKEDPPSFVINVNTLFERRDTMGKALIIIGIIACASTLAPLLAYIELGRKDKSLKNKVILPIFIIGVACIIAGTILL